MRLGLNMGYSGARLSPRLELVQEAERLGFDSVWAAEAYGSDVVSMLAWYAAHTERIRIGSAVMQMPARSPAATAMTAATLAELSGGRFVLGLGTSGPQVAEGWHGRPFARPLARTREYVDLVRRALDGEMLVHDGEHYPLPYRGPDATGLGKPLRMTLRVHHRVPVYLAAIGPRNVALAAEIADGWLPIFFSPERAEEVFGDHLREGFAGARQSDEQEMFDIAAVVPVVVTDDPARGRDAVRAQLALYVGGMGAPGRNYYFDLVCRYGYEQSATAIREAYLDARRRDALAAVPDELIDEIALIGTPDMIEDRLEAWQAAGVTTLIAAAADVRSLRTLAELVL